MTENTVLYTIMTTNDAENDAESGGLAAGVESMLPGAVLGGDVGENFDAGAGVENSDDRGGGGSGSDGGGSDTLHLQEGNFISKGDLDGEVDAGAEGGGVDRGEVSQVLAAIETPQGTEKPEKEEVTRDGRKGEGQGEGQGSADFGRKKEGGGGEAVAEAELAADVGLTRQKLGQLRVERGLKEGVHWKKKGRAVVYLWAGVLRVREVLGLPAEAAASKKKESPQRDLWVFARCRNARIVLAVGSEAEATPSRTGRGALTQFRVRVRNNANFRMGMKLPGCLAVDEAHGLWELQGKMPRRPGRW